MLAHVGGSGAKSYTGLSSAYVHGERMCAYARVPVCCCVHLQLHACLSGGRVVWLDRRRGRMGMVVRGVLLAYARARVCVDETCCAHSP
jgi:hypothetical protein